MPLRRQIGSLITDFLLIEVVFDSNYGIKKISFLDQVSLGLRDLVVSF